MSEQTPSGVIGGRYRLLEKLGTGGMGVVYRALDRLTGQQVALKRVLFSEGADEDDLDMRVALAQEFQVLASLRHPHIISVLDYGFDAQRWPYFTMDLLQQPHTILKAGQPLPLRGKVRLLVQTLQALAYLHRRGVLHRDLKPGNVLVDDGQVKVLDFGLSMELGPEHGIVGTPAYMAPELLQGEPASTATDLYAVGVMAYELLAGRHPFDTSNISRLIAQVINTPPDLTQLSINLEAIPGPESPPGTLPEAGEELPGDLGDEPTVTKVPHEQESAPAAEPADPHQKTTQAGFGYDQPTRVHVPDDQKTTRPNVTIDVPSPPPRGESAPPANPLVGIVQRLLAKNPLDRYADAITVIRDLSGAIGEPLPVETAATRESFLQAARFVGREAEFRQLTAALEGAMARRGSAWLIGGESGVGKSRLLNELRICAVVTGALVLRGQEVSEGGARYQVWREPLRRLALTTYLNDADAGVIKALVPDVDDLIGRPVPLAPELEPELARQRLLAVIGSIFHRQQQPIVLILEDLHWSGDESLVALNQISQQVSELPLLVLGSYRDDERPALPETLPEMRVLRLNRLDETAIAALSESMLGSVGRQPHVLNLLQRETEGNVFFLVEVVRALAEEAGQLDRIGDMTLPAQVFTGGVQRIVQRRLERVPEAARPLLQVAAVLGRELDLPVLHTAFPIQDIDSLLNACADAAVLEVHDDRWRFTHDKLRDGVLALLPEQARPALHRHVALALETTRPDQIVALAYHWGIAGNRPRELRYVIQAGEQADRVSAYQDALTYFKRALELDPPAEQHARLRFLLGRVYARLNEHADATRHLRESLEMAQESGDRKVLADALCNLGNVARAQGNHAEAARHYTTCIEVSQQIDDRRAAADALRGLARVAGAQGDYAGAKQRLEESLTVFREIGDLWGTAYALSDLSVVATLQGDHSTAARRLEESLEIFREIGDRRGVATALINLGQVAIYEGEYAEAVLHFEESLAISREIGDRWSIAATLNNLGYIALLQGEYARARLYLEESLALFHVIGDRAAVVQTLTNLGHVATGLDDDQLAGARFREALESAQAMAAAPLMLEILAGIARLRFKAGEAEDALVLVGLALNHPGTNSDIRGLAEPLLAELRNRLPTAAVESALERGKAQDLNAVVAAVLAQDSIIP